MGCHSVNYFTSMQECFKNNWNSCYGPIFKFLQLNIATHSSKSPALRTTTNSFMSSFWSKYNFIHFGLLLDIIGFRFFVCLRHFDHLYAILIADNLKYIQIFLCTFLGFSQFFESFQSILVVFQVYFWVY